MFHGYMSGHHSKDSKHKSCTCLGFKPSQVRKDTSMFQEDMHLSGEQSVGCSPGRELIGGYRFKVKKPIRKCQRFNRNCHENDEAAKP